MFEDTDRRLPPLTHPERARLLDRLDEESDAAGRPAPGARLYQRESYRWSCRLADIPVTVEHPSGGISRIVVFTRNVSALGVSVLHGEMICPGSTCRIVLPRIDGETPELRGTIVSCRPIGDDLYEIGVMFRTPIDPKPYLEVVQTNRDAIG